MFLTGEYDAHIANADASQESAGPSTEFRQPDGPRPAEISPDQGGLRGF